MTAPFVAISWDARREAAAAGAEAAGRRLADGGWASSWRGEGLVVWLRPERPAPLTEPGPPGAAILVGRLAGAGRACGDPGTERAVASARARAGTLCRSGWGAYVALLRDPAGADWRIFRDPSGAVEAYTWTLGEVGVCASGVDGLPPGLLPARLSLDWSVIADLIRSPAARAGQPALRGIEWVAPGDLQAFGAASATALAVWRPAHWVSDRELDEADWRDRLRATLAETVDGLVRPHRRVLTEASGGLDSSLVNGAIGRLGLAGRVAAALHYAGDRSEAEEQHWADAVCDLWGLPLLRIERGIVAIDPEQDFAELCRDVRPPFGALDPVRDRDTAARLRETGAEALVTGKGGDAVFFQMPTVQVVADLWRAKGRAAVRHPANAEVARWLRRSVWSVWREALQGAAGAPATTAAAFAGRALYDLPAGPPHPWLARLDLVPPAKRIQIQALVAGQAGGGPHRRGRAAEVAHPLLAQPMMELCLSIPSWRLVEGGRDRALARRAFTGWAPEAVLQRRSKGALTSLYCRRVAAGADALRAHLLDGVLARAGLLDAARMEAALAPDQLMRRLDGVDLVAMAALESWVRYWQGRVADAPDAPRPRP